MTEKKIRCVRLNNIKDLLASAKHYAPVNIKKNIGQFDMHLKKFLKESPQKFNLLVRLMQPFVPIALEEIISLVKYKIYFQQVYIDWDIPLEKNVIILNEKILNPLYELPEIHSTTENDIISTELTEEGKSTIISNEDKKIYEERLELITPLINTFGNEGKRGKIEDFCQKNDLPFGRTYRWYLKWKKEGNGSLIPKHSRVRL